MTEAEKLKEAAEQANNYLLYRGKCKELSEAWIAEHPEYRLVRGYYYDACWGQQPHWWTVAPDGTIHDPSKLQFPTQGKGIYEEYDGQVICDWCEAEGVYWGDDDPRNTPGWFHSSNYVFCSNRCACRFVGI